jgi:hypothetical protein
MSREAAIAERLRERYPARDWALLRHVPSATGGSGRGEVRIIDLAAVALCPSMGARVEIIEIKCRADDLDDELEHPEKIEPFLRFASAVWFAVPAPYHRVVRSKRRLPMGRGLLSVGTGKPDVIVPAEEREPAQALPDFARSLLRAAVTRPDPGAGLMGPDGVPLRPVARPFSHEWVVLACLHRARLPVPKSGLVPCVPCLPRLPPEPEAIEAAIGDATPEQLARFAALCDARRAA